MAQATGTTDTLDLVGIAEDVEDVIWNISPEETPFISKISRTKVSNTFHQWQTDALAAAAANRAIEGDESTYATATPTVMLANYTQISKKTVKVSGTADAVRKYGRAKETAYQMMKKGKELKRDIEFAAITNQVSSVGGNSTARSSAGVEVMISGNRILSTGNTTGTTPGFAAGVWGPVTDGTAATFVESDLVAALAAAWTDGGDVDTIYVGTNLKARIATFGGATKYAGFYNPKQGAAQGMVIGGVDLYVSDFGQHKIVLNRYMRTGTLLALDTSMWSLGFLRPIQVEERAKTGDATNMEMLAEFTLIGRNPDSSAKIQSLI